MDYIVQKPENLQWINELDVGELLWWSYALDTNPETIIATIKKIGNRSEDVKKAIRLLKAISCKD